MSKAASPLASERPLSSSSTREPSEPGPGDGEELELTTPTTANVTVSPTGWAEHAPLRTSSPESLPPSPPPGSKQWKGKGKAVDFDLNDQAVVDGDSRAKESRQPRSTRSSQQVVERADSINQSLVSGGAVYPPATEDVVEERRVAETLKRWEQLERQRRKVARETRGSVDTTRSSMSFSQSSPPHPGDAQRRGTLFWSRTGDKSRKPAPGSQPLPTGEGDAEDVESQGVVGDEFAPPESEDIAVVKPSTHDDDDDARERFIQQQKRHKTSSSIDSHISDSSIATVTPGSTMFKVQVTGPTPSNSSTNPFVDPSSPQSTKASLARNPSTASDPFKDTPSTSSPSRSQTLQPPSARSHSKHNNSKRLSQPQPRHASTAGAVGMKRPPRYPTPKPLGLPVTAIVSESDQHIPEGSEDEEARSETDSRSSSQQEHEHDLGRHSTAESLRREERRQMVEGGDENPERDVNGHWWTEWLCGCSEGPNRGGDHQAGKTNPFE